MGQGLVVAILSILFYLSSLLGGTAPAPPVPQALEDSFFFLGQSGEILGEKVLVRENPTTESSPQGTLRQNEEVTILAKQADWYKIRSNSKLEGWIPAFHLRLKDIPAAASERLDKVVLGYLAPDDLAYESLLENNLSLTGVVPLGWRMDSYGALNADFAGEDLGKTLYFAGNRQLETYALIEVNTEPVKLFNNTYLQAQTAAAIVETVREWGLKGAQLAVNYEPADYTGLAAFLETLNAKLEAEGYKTIVALPLSPAADYKALAGCADYLVVQPKLELKNPGPPAPLDEIKKALRAVLLEIPAHKVILGIDTAGHNWPRRGEPISLSYGEVMELAAQWGVSIKWDAQSMSPYFEYGNGGEVWFENRYSLKYKLDLVKEFDLAGLALSDLGREDPEVWNTLKKLF